MTDLPSINTYIPRDICDLYEIHNYRNAAQVLATSCPQEFSEIIEALRTFRLTLDDIRKPGGNVNLIFQSDFPLFYVVRVGWKRVLRVIFLLRKLAEVCLNGKEMREKKKRIILKK